MSSIKNRSVNLPRTNEIFRLRCDDWGYAIFRFIINLFYTDTPFNEHVSPRGCLKKSIDLAMPPKKKQKTKLLKSEKLCLAKQIQDDSSRVYKLVKDKILAVGRKLCESRMKFVEMLCKDEETLSGLIDVMVQKYLFLFKKHMRQNRSLEFQQSWFLHLNSEYFPPCQADQAIDTQPGAASNPIAAADINCHESVQAWQAVLKKCSPSTTVDQKEQRIILSTIAYLVFDEMTEKVKDYKFSVAEAPVANPSSPVKPKFMESNVSLYRYGGFALHSLIKKLQKQHETPKKSGHSQQSIANAVESLSILKLIKVKEDQKDDLPNAIKLLNQGGLTIVSPLMLPYLRAVLSKLLHWLIMI